MLKVNKDLKTMSPINPVEKPKDLSFNASKEDKELYSSKLEEWKDAENNLPIYNIIGSMCKSGIFIKADILKYHENDIREVEHKENGVIVLGPYK